MGKEVGKRKNRNIFKKALNSVSHPILSIMPRVKSPNFNFRKKISYRPKINTHTNTNILKTLLSSAIYLNMT